MRINVLQASTAYSFNCLPMSSPITQPRRFCRVIRAQVEGTGDNVLAKHAEFFDKNNDGVIYPWETYKGFRAIGSNIVLSTAAAVVINVGLSTKTRPDKKPENLKVDDNENESCEGANEEECLMRRTLVAHTDYIYTQHQNP